MNNAEFETAIKAAGGKLSFFTKGSYISLMAFITDGEKIVAASECIDGKGAGAIIVTDRNFYASKATGMLSSTKVNIPLDKITSYSISSGFLSKDLNISEGAVIRTFPQVSNPDGIIMAIQAGKSVTPSAESSLANPPAQDVTAELRKFKALLDDGIITQEDFDKKKTMLLGI
jgi:hypothetical protein